MQYCGQPGCGVVVERGYCPEHVPPDRRQLRDERQGNSNDRGYTYRWYTRARLFRQHYPLCGQRPEGQSPVMSECWEAGRAVIADLVDHVVPHKGNPTLFWDELHNWQSLCEECHARKTGAGY